MYDPDFLAKANEAVTAIAKDHGVEWVLDVERDPIREIGYFQTKDGSKRTPYLCLMDAYRRDVFAHQISKALELLTEENKETQK